MSTTKLTTNFIMVTLKFRPENTTTGGTRYPLTVSDSRDILLIQRSGQPEAIGIFAYSGDRTETYVHFKLVNKYSKKSVEKSFTRNIVRGWGWDSFITLKKALDRNAGWLDCEGNLTLEVTVSEPARRRRAKVHSELVENVFKHAQTVKNLTVCSGDGKEYEMNEYIFASHSELLTTHLRNKSNGKVVFKSVQSEVMDEFIHYLKTGLINESAESVAFDLAELAHMYDLKILFELVEPLLVKQVASGQLTRVIKIAKLFSSKPLFEAIGKIAEVSEEHLSDESDDFTVEVHGQMLSIKQAFLALKHPHLNSRRDAITTALQATTLQAAKGFIGFLKTSKLDDLSDCIFEYATLAQALLFPDLSRLVEQELVANTSKYDRSKVEDLAETLKSVKICRALAALP